MCDAQTGYESLLTGLLPALAGANLIYGTGMLDSGMVLDYGKMLLDDEINLAIKRIAAGVAVDDATLAVDLIDEVGRDGNYLTHPSTFNHFSGLLRPRLMNRESYEIWTNNGQPDLVAQARQIARDLVQNHQPEPLSLQAQKEIEDIIRETEKERQLR